MSYIIKARNASGRPRYKCFVYTTSDDNADTSDFATMADVYDDEASAQEQLARLEPWAQREHLTLWVEPYVAEDDEEEEEEGIYHVVAHRLGNPEVVDCYLVFGYGDVPGTTDTAYDEFAYTKRSYAEAGMASATAWAQERGLVLSVQEFKDE